MMKYYFDFLSQPARALWIALKISKTPFESCPVALRKREHQTKEYKHINRFGKVPCIVDGDFNLTESIAITRYLAAKNQFSDTLYPKELKYQARVDEFLEWQHLGLRFACTMYFRRLWLLPVSGLAHLPCEEKSKELRKQMEESLKIIENIWLKDTKFLTGSQLTVADIFGACEIEQTRLTKYDVKRSFPKTADWIARVRDETNPHYDEAHEYIYKKSA